MRAADFASLAADAAVRHGCAAQSSALTASHHHHSSSRAGRSPAHRLNVEGSRLSRPQPGRHSSSLLPQRSYRVFPIHNHARQTALTARPPWLAVPPRHRSQRIPFSGASRLHSPQARLRPSRHIESRREARNAQRRSTGGSRLHITSSAHRPRRPRAWSSPESCVEAVFRETT